MRNLLPLECYQKEAEEYVNSTEFIVFMYNFDRHKKCTPDMHFDSILIKIFKKVHLQNK